MKKIITDFSYGELSKKWDGRSDLPYYTKGCSELRNMYVMPQGVAGRISGTKYLASLPSGNWNYEDSYANPIKLIPFYYKSYKFIVMITTGNPNGFLRVYNTDGTIEYSTGYSIDTYAVSRTQAVQIDNTLYISRAWGPYMISTLTCTGITPTFSMSNVPLPATTLFPIQQPLYATASALCAYQGRLITGNITGEAMYKRMATLCASKTLAPTDFTTGNNDADAWITDITDGFVDIKWMTGTEDGLVVGCQDCEFYMQGGNNGLTPTTLQQKKLSNFGSSEVIPEQIGLSTIFVERDKKVVRELAYRDVEGALSSPNLTLLSDHITGKDGLREIHYQRTPFECLYCIRQDGKIAMLTHDRNTGITAWSLIDVGGYVTGLCALTGDTQDDIYIAVSRNVAGKATYYLEKFDPFEQEEKTEWNYMFSSLVKKNGSKGISNMQISSGKVLVTSTSHGFNTNDHIQIKNTDIDGIYTVEVVDANSFYIKENGSYVTDYGTDTTGTALLVTKTFTGFTHLPNYEVAVMADGDYIGKFTLDGSGNLTIDRFANKIVAGLPYTSHIKTMRLVQELGSPVARITKVFLRFYKSLGCKVGQTMDDGEELSFRDGELDLDSPDLYTGDKEHTMLTEYSNKGYFYIWQDEPMPMNICALTIDFRAGGQRQ